jgi:DNA-binding XRE family transcriptional regulator
MGIGGSRVAQLRKARGLTQSTLARRAGISVSLLSKMTRNPYPTWPSCTPIGPVHINTARARLDLGDRNGAQTSLGQAWSCPAPQRSVARCSPLACLLGP